MKTITINKFYNQNSSEQTFSYTQNAPLGHIKKHLAAEVSYARKGQPSVLNPTVGPLDLKISLSKSTGLSVSETDELKLFLEKL